MSRLLFVLFAAATPAFAAPPSTVYDDEVCFAPGETTCVAVVDADGNGSLACGTVLTADPTDETDAITWRDCARQGGTPTYIPQWGEWVCMGVTLGAPPTIR